MKKLPSQYDEAIIGVAQACGEPSRVVYSEAALIDILASEMPDLDRKDILEHYEVNFLQARSCDDGPMFLIRLDEDPFLEAGEDELEEIAGVVQR